MKTSKADVYRQYNLPEKLIRSGGLKSLLRYANPIEKGVYWYWFSRQIRQRDVSKYGTCISCGRELTFETAQAGHFIPAVKCDRELLFDFQNVNAECAGCNAFDEFHLVPYARNLDKRWGAGTADSLEARKKAREENKEVIRDWKGDVYARLIRELPIYQASLTTYPESYPQVKFS